MGQAGRVFVAALVQLPAAWVLVGITVAAFGLTPRLAAVGWIALTVFLLLGEFGGLFGLDQWVMDLSPFAHTPRLPGVPVSAAPLVVLTILAAALGAGGLAALRRRDIA
jgi:ABC-2 type transport system permease protein